MRTEETHEVPNREDPLVNTWLRVLTKHNKEEFRINARIPFCIILQLELAWVSYLKKSLKIAGVKV
jgi:hypothetical protein